MNRRQAAQKWPARIEPVIDPNVCCGKPRAVAADDPAVLVCLECFDAVGRPACPLCGALADVPAPDRFQCPHCKAEGFACCVPGHLVSCLICQEDESK